MGLKSRGKRKAQYDSYNTHHCGLYLGRSMSGFSLWAPLFYTPRQRLKLNTFRELRAQAREYQCQGKAHRHRA